MSKKKLDRVMLSLHSDDPDTVFRWYGLRTEPTVGKLILFHPDWLIVEYPDFVSLGGSEQDAEIKIYRVLEYAFQHEKIDVIAEQCVRWDIKKPMRMDVAELCRRAQNDPDFWKSSCGIRGVNSTGERVEYVSVERRVKNMDRDRKFMKIIQKLRVWFRLFFNIGGN